MTQAKKIELLAPAGSVTALRAVIAAGADAVYIGGSRFGARAYADNPDENDLLSAIDYAHLRGVKVYLTVNTLLKNNELTGLYEYLLPYYMRGIDAVLVQDLGVLRYLHRVFPDLPLHASTQMTVTGPESAKLLKSYGVTRVVPAREMTLRELQLIGSESGLEVEAFVHGALCVCMSGMCLASSLIGGRSGNRGRCAQPCRLIYEAEGVRAELLSPKDLCTLDLLPDMIEHGVVSLKIEGRMKQPEYAAGVVSIYRKYLDLYLTHGRKNYRVSRADKDELLTLFNRDGFTDGYLRRHNGREMMAFSRHTLSPKEEKERSALYDRMHESYVAHGTSVPLGASVRVLSGQPLSIGVNAPDTDGTGPITVEVRGELVTPAENRPLTKERIARQINKTGGSDFTFADLDVTTDGQSFVPMGALSQLRRDALGMIRGKMLARFSREVPQTAQNGSVFNEDMADSDVHSIIEEGMAVAVDTVDQFAAAVSSGFVKRIYINESILEGRDNLAGLVRQFPGETAVEDIIYAPDDDNSDYMKKARFLIRICQEHEKSPYIMLPFIERYDFMPEFYSHVDALISAGIVGFIARSFETAAHLINLGYAEMTLPDAGVYTWNRESIAWASENGFHSVTAPYELNRKELIERGGNNTEIVVYGRLPLMVTASCLRKNITGCTGGSDTITMRDRTKRDFPVKCDCVFCYNTVYNSEVLSLIEEYTFLMRAGYARWRVSFTTETYREAENVLTAFEDAYAFGRTGTLAVSYTKGHMNRGVE